MLPKFATFHPYLQVIYIAPLKALVRERIKDWGQGFCRTLGKRMVELTGDYTPDMVSSEVLYSAGKLCFRRQILPN